MESHGGGGKKQKTNVGACHVVLPRGRCLGPEPCQQGRREDQRRVADYFEGRELTGRHPHGM